MPQEEYDQYINNARAWRKTLFGRWEEERDKLTKLLIERIKSKGSNSARERLEYLKNKIKNF
jgi:hypothetical protein